MESADGVAGSSDSTSGRVVEEGLRPPAEEYLFSGVEILAPLQELEQVYLKRSRGLHGDEGGRRGERLSRAYRIAQEQLRRALTPRGVVRPAGATAPEPPPEPLPSED